MMKALLLDISLVPSSSWFNNVRSILTKSQWDILRKKVYSEAWYVCEICSNIGPKHPVECHEIWEYDDKKLIQKLTGMIALCPNCHMVKHIGLAQIQNKSELALNHFMLINKLTKKQAVKYIEECFETWKSRSKKEWSIDISILERYGIHVKKI